MQSISGQNPGRSKPQHAPLVPARVSSLSLPVQRRWERLGCRGGGDLTLGYGAQSASVGRVMTSMIPTHWLALAGEA
eukprot:3070342-Amphidinium_carterae.1